MNREESWLGSIKRGFSRCCPRCGTGGMFAGYLRVSSKCRRCGLDFDTIRSDDIAPYFTVLIVGHLMVPLLLLLEQRIAPPVDVTLAIFLPLTLALTLVLLPFVKGAVMGAIWMSKRPA